MEIWLERYLKSQMALYELQITTVLYKRLSLGGPEGLLQPANNHWVGIVRGYFIHLRPPVFFSIRAMTEARELLGGDITFLDSLLSEVWGSPSAGLMNRHGIPCIVVLYNTGTTKV